MTNETPKSGDRIGTREKFLMACGYAVKEGPYNNMSSTSGGSNFSSAIGSASGLGGIGSALSSLSNLSSFSSIIPSGTGGNKKDIKVAPNWTTVLDKVAREMASYGSIKFAVAKKFLLILISVDDYEIMKKIADAVQIAELANESILLNAMEILSIPKLYTAAFFAEALFSIIDTYSSLFPKAANRESGQGSSSDSVVDILNKINGNLGVLSSLTSTGGGFGAGKIATSGASSDNIFGNVLTKLITGQEVPMGIQSNNPMLQSPSLIGKMLFGEAPSGTAAIDPNQLFAKPIAVFSQMQGGAGSQMFNFKNVGSYKAPQSLDDVIKKVAFGGITPDADSYAEDILKQLQNNVGNMLGASGSAQVNMTQPDNMIPISSALSDALTNITTNLPHITQEYREYLEKLTDGSTEIKDIFQKGLTLDRAKELGLNKATTQVPPINIVENVTKVFPSSVFQKGFQDVMYANQYLKSINPNFAKVLELI